MPGRIFWEICGNRTPYDAFWVSFCFYYVVTEKIIIKCKLCRYIYPNIIPNRIKLCVSFKGFVTRADYDFSSLLKIVLSDLNSSA